MYSKKAHIHFVGIGGIGMSGIATILHDQGYRISGCDRDLQQQSIKNLLALGCLIYQGNNTTGCTNSSIGIVVYSSAIKSNNPEIIMAQQRGIPTIPRALMLTELMRTKYSIAVAGSHGKTTTTSLISHILIEAGIDPTVIIGGHLKTISANARFGKGDFLVAEADESDRSLQYLQATLAVITNIDLEHLETYKDIDDIKQVFMQFLNNLPFYGKAILCLDDEQVRSLLPISHIKTITYGLNPAADIYATDIVLQPEYSTCTIQCKNNAHPLGSLHINMPGKHNIQNALGALTLARELAIPFPTIAKSLQNFKGIERRFSFRGVFKGAEIFDDYAHHPKEIENALIVARNRAKNRLMVVFQPHRFTRMHKLWDHFIQTFLASPIDHLIITDIYSASEEPIAQVTSRHFVQTLKKHNPSFSVTYTPYAKDFVAIKKEIEETIHENDLLLLLGAGKINQLASLLC